MFKTLNIQSFSHVSQRPVGGIEKHVRTFVILWSYPLPFQDSPKRFCNVQMWGVWRKEEDKEAPLLPYWPEFRFTHAFTDTKLISVCAPAFAAERPSAFRRTARQRIRKQCFSPLRKPLSSSRRCASVNSNTFAFPITNNRTGNTNVCFV